MISFNQFVKCMRKEMGKKFQGRLTIKVEKVEKNNGVVITYQEREKIIRNGLALV